MHVREPREGLTRILLIMVALLVVTPCPGWGRAQEKSRTRSADELRFRPAWGANGMVVTGRADWLLNLPLGNLPSGTRRLLLNRGAAGGVERRAEGLRAERNQPWSGNANRNAPPPITSDTFTNAAGGGNWNNAGNWSAGLPNSGDNVLITGSGSASSVTEDVSATINNLTLNSGDSWSLNNGFGLTLDGNSISNSGNMTLNSTGSNTILELATSVTLSGTGTLTMSNKTTNYIYGAATADTLTNQETIQGAGIIGDGQMTLVNSSTINANQSAGMTIDPNGGITNTGTIEATGGTLALINTTVTNTSGTISDNGKTLQLTNVTVNGGAVTLTGAADLQLYNGIIQSGSTLTNSSTGTIEAFAGTSTLGGTVINPAGGVLKIDNGAVLELQNGSYPNLGTMQLNSSGSNTLLEVAGANVTLSGGSVTLSNEAVNYIYGAATADTLTNQETIQGAGIIGDGQMTLVNSGTINANQSAGMTIDPNGGITNTGTIEATGGTLSLSGTTVTNTGGTITSNGQLLQMTNVTVNGGAVTLTGAADLQLYNGIIQNGSTLTNSSTGTLEAFAGTSTLGGTVINPAGGLLKIDNGAELELQNGSYPTLGTVQLNSSGSNTILLVAGANVTLSGGSLTMANHAQNYIYGAATADTLTNQETIQGAGVIGNGQMTLVNSGTINANQSAGMTINPNGGVTNTGTIEATGGTLLLSGTTVTNSGGTISAGGETLQMINATINGGAVTLTGASTLQLTNGIIQSGSTLTNSSTGTIEVVAGTSTLGGTIVNPAGGLLKIDNGAVLDLQNGTYPTLGAVQVNSSGSNTELVVAGAGVTLSGGSVTMSNFAQNYILGAASTDVLTNQETIQGSGNIGNGGLGLVNSGTITANQSVPLLIDTSSTGFNNQGTVQANSGSTLEIEGTLTNFLNYNSTTQTLTGGSYVAAGTVEFPTGTVIATNAATLELSGSGTFTNIGGVNPLATFATNAAAGTFNLQGGANFTTAGNFTNNGTLIAGAGSTFDVNGNLTNISSGTITGGTYSLAGILKATNASGITTNAANITLTGSGAIENQSGANALSGLATNSSGASFTVNGGATFTTAGSFTNAGSLTVGSGGTFNKSVGNYTNSGATTIQSGGIMIDPGTIISTGTFTNGGTLETNSGGTMDIQGGAIANNGGTILATGAGAQVLLDGATISGGTLSSTGGGVLVAENVPTLNGSTNAVTLSTGSTLQVNNGQTLQLSGTLTNNGAASLTSSGSNTELLLTASSTLAGTGTLTLSSNAANLITASAGTDVLTNSSTIQGSGTISGLLLNNSGTLDADQTTSLIVNPATGTNTNTKTLEATAGGTLDLKGTWTNTGGTILATGTGSQVLLDGATISGGTLTSASSGTLVGENSAVLNGSTGAVTISTGSTLKVNNGKTLDAKGTITNNGTVSLNATAATTQLLLTANTTLGGTGKLTLSNNANNLIAGSTSTVVLTNKETIQGSGSIGTATKPIGLVNSKTITANQSTPLIINASTSGFNNKGTLSVSAGDTLTINGTFKNFASGTLTGGTYTVTGTLNVPTGDNITANAATITLTGAAAEIRNPAGSGSNALGTLASNASTGKFTATGGQVLSDSVTAFSNGGTLTVGAGSQFNLTGGTATYTQTAGTTTVDGTLTAQGGIAFNGGSVFGKGGTLSVGATGTATDNATFNVGDAAMTAGTETVSGMYNQTSTGALDIDIGGTTAGTQFDQLIVSGTASLNGILNLDLINGFVPTLTDTFEILTTSALTGTFLTVNGTGINSNEHFGVVYNATNVTLDVLSGPSGAGAWGGGSLPSGSVPPSPAGSPSATPEPGSLVLLGTGLLGLASYARRRMRAGSNS